MRRALVNALLLALALACRASRPGLPILTYHSVGPEADAFTVTESAFAEQLDVLQRAGFSTVTLHDWVEHQDHGASLPKKPVVLTFDDGYEDAITRVLPLLRARRMRGTFFIVSAWIAPDEGHRRHCGTEGAAHPCLVWPEVRALAAAGMEIGSHGARHLRLPNLPEAQVREELVRSRRELEEDLHVPVDLFAYPFNSTRGWVAALVPGAGYRAAVAGVVHGSGDRFRLYRIGVYHTTTAAQLLREAESASP